MKPPRSLSLRSKFILIVLGGAVLPLALLGLWLTRTAERSGEELLRSRLQASLDQVVAEVGLRWLSQRSQLLGLAECPAAQAALRDSAAGAEAEDAALVELQALFVGMSDAVGSAEILDVSGGVRWTIGGDDGGVARAGMQAEPPLTVRVGVFDVASGNRLGSIDAHVRMSRLLPGGAGWGGVSGTVLAVFDRGTGASLMPLSIDPSLFAREAFVWGEEPWLTVRHVLHEPPMHLVLAAPVTPFAEPFQEAARQNLWLLVIVAVGGFALATLLTRRTTGALVRLAAAAEAVSRGDLERRVEEVAGDEVGRVARAFNSMTESLRQTLRELSKRQALAAVGEFAASLAHEVRNPLTSIRLDLQRVEERLPDDWDARELLGRALGEIERVDRSVTGALRVARSGRIGHDLVDLRQPLEAALHSAEPEFRTRGARIEEARLGGEPIWVRGDAAALEQLFLNLLLNAGQALEAEGRAGVEVMSDGGEAFISIWDSGCGIEPDQLARVFEPFYSTRPEGTGLGLAIAQRIAVAHSGDLSIESTPGTGTTVRVRLPLGAAGPA